MGSFQDLHPQLQTATARWLQNNDFESQAGLLAGRTETVFRDDRQVEALNRRFRLKVVRVK